MTDTSPGRLAGDDRGTAVRTFVIADIRGYSTFTRERGHADAARLAARFVDLAGDAIEARGGHIVEIRGDEVLAVFASPVPGVRAAVELQAACAEESDADPTLAVPVGVGIATGDSVLRGVQYHGASLNLAARLCAKALTGEVLITAAVAELCDGAADLDLAGRGPSEFKGFDEPVEVVAVSAHDTSVPIGPATVEPSALQAELDPLTPMVGRERELHWLRGTWRMARRGHGRVVVASGQAGIGKTRLAGALAAEVQRMGGRIRYAGPGGTATADALGEIRGLAELTGPTLVVLDGLDAGTSPVAALAEAGALIGARPAMVLCLVRDPDTTPELAALAAEAEREDGHRRLSSLDLEGVQQIARLYAGEDLTAVPVESVLRASHGIPDRIHEVMSEWARAEATRRLTAAAEYLAEGRTRRSADLGFANNVIGLKLGRIYAVEERTLTEDAPCPYKGLASFQGEDAASFFGRERLVGELAARTVQVGLLGVIGASGSGKSSVVAAGLVPSLSAGLLPGSERWTQVSLRPGEHPMAELGSAVSSLGPHPGADTLEAAIASLGPQGRLVLFVDQFEEVFTTCGDDDEREVFVEALTAAATSSPERIVVVIALRGDFYGHCARFSAFAELLASNHVPIGPMSAEELHRAIELPARRSGVRVESALADALIGEVADEPGALPLLSTALVELWNARSDGWLRTETYEATGGLRGAVTRLAEGTYEALNDQERQRARTIFLRLVGPGEGDSVTRRRAPLEEFDLDRDAVAASVLTRLTRDRLLTVSETTVEVAHEALLREWPRLRDWIEEDAEGQQLRQHLIQAANRWEASGRDDSELYRGARLSATLDWSVEHGGELNELERTFVANSREASERESKRIRTTNRRLRGLLVGVAIFLVVALIAGGIALIQRGQARRAATIALSQSLGERGILLPRLDTGLLLATAGLKLDDSARTRSDLLATLLRSPSAIGIFPVGTNGTRPEGIAVSPDGRTLAVVNNVIQLSFFDTQSRTLVGKPVPLKELVTPIYTPDGSMLALQGSGGVQLLDARTHKLVRKLQVDPHGAALFGFSSDGRTAYGAAYGDPYSYLVRWDMATGQRLGTVKVAALTSNMALATRTGQVLTATAIDGGVRIDVRGGSKLALNRSFSISPLLTGGFGTLAVDPEGTTGAFMGNSSGGSIHFVDLRTGHVTVGIGALGPLQAGQFTSDGKSLISLSANSASQGDVILWDVASASVTSTLTGQHGAANTNFPSIAIDASGRTLFTDNFDGTVFEWDLSKTRGFGRPFTTGKGGWSDPYGGYSYPYFSVSPDGTKIAATEAGGKVNIVDLAAGNVISSFRVPGVSSVYQAEFSPDGTELLVSPGPQKNGTITLWRLGAGAPTLVRSFSGLVNVPCTTANGCPAGIGPAPWATFSPDGKWIAGLDVSHDGTDGHLIEWNAATGGKRVNPLDLHAAAANAGDVAFSPKGSLIAVSPGKQVVILNAANLKEVHRFTPDFLGAQMIAFSPDGSSLATVSYSGMIRLWDTTTWKETGNVLAFAGPGSWIAFDPTGSQLIATGYDGTTRIWSIPSLEQIGTTLPSLAGTEDSLVAASAFTGEGRDAKIVLVYSDGKAIEWPASVSAWQQQACAVAGRNLTRVEWDLYLPGRPYERICSGA